MSNKTASLQNNKMGVKSSASVTHHLPENGQEMYVMADDISTSM